MRFWALLRKEKQIMVKRYSFDEGDEAYYDALGFLPEGYADLVPAADYDALAAELAETQRQLKMVAPIGKYNGRDIEGWAKRAGEMEAALAQANADLKAVWIETGKGLDGLKRTEVALGLTAPETEAQHIDRLALAGCTCPMYEKLHRSGCPAIDMPKNRQVETKVEQPEVGYPEPGPFPGPTDRGRRSW